MEETGIPMCSKDEPTLCHKCGVREATNFVCHAGMGKSVAWCDECLEAEDPKQAGFAAVVKAARCRYCGGYPCSGGTDPFSFSGMGMQEQRWMCMSCAMEYYPLAQKALSRIAGDHLTAVEQVERMKAALNEVEEQMHEFVRVRDN